MKNKRSVWESKPKDTDYAAAEKFLTLLFSPADARAITGNLRIASTEHDVAKDLLRASQTQLRDNDNPHVRDELKTIK